MDMLYPISFLVSLTGLVAWFFVQGNKTLSKPASLTFLLGFLTYLLALTLSPAEVSYKFLILFRDLVVIGVVSQLFNIFKKSAILSLVLAAAVALTVYFSYFNVLTYTFPQLETSELDEGGEFFVQIESPDLVQYLEENFECSLAQAFDPADKDITELDEYWVVDATNNTRHGRKKLYGQLMRTEGIAWLEPNEIFSLEFPEEGRETTHKSDYFLNDPQIAQQWGFIPMDVDALHRELASSGLKPRKVAEIAIIDSGVDGNHEDIKGNYQSFKQAYDTDVNGHGTHCAGIAGAVSNNGVGVASLSPSTGYVRITGYKVINNYGIGSQKQVVKGMIEAVDNGADVLSMSLGGPTQRKRERIYKEAVDYALKQGAIVVVAAGNNNSKANTVTPANVDGVIAVAAVDENGKKASFSNTVADLKMGVAAPGVNIVSTFPGNNYKSLNGTSMAAPYVSGLIGLMKSFKPDLTAEEAYFILQKTGSKTKDGASTGLLIQPKAAINELVD